SHRPSRERRLSGADDDRAAARTTAARTTAARTTAARTTAARTTAAGTTTERRAIDDRAAAGTTGAAACLPRLRRDEKLAGRLGDDGVVLVAAQARHHADAALVLRLVDALLDRPLRGEGVAGLDRRGEAAVMLEVGDGGAGKVHPHRRGDERGGERAMQDARAEAAPGREALVDVQRIEVAEEPGGEDE